MKKVVNIVVKGSRKKKTIVINYLLSVALQDMLNCGTMKLPWAMGTIGNKLQEIEA